MSHRLFRAVAKGDKRVMKTQTQKNKRLEVRINDEDLKLLKVASFCIGQTPSQMVRMFIDSTINSLKVKIQKGELKLEDFQTILND